MILYVDETESSEVFIVCGLLVIKKEDIEIAYKRFKKYADKAISVSPKKKSVLFAEFKSTLMDNHYQKAKKVMLGELNQISCCVIYSCYNKGETFSQREKERTYINLISKIAASIDETVEIYFDRFQKPSFEANIIKKLTSYSHVTQACAVDSLYESGIKFVDNLCSSVRRRKTNSDTEDFYGIVSHIIKEV